MDIYERACQKVPLDHKLDVYEVYVSRAMDFFGVQKVRSIYNAAVEEELPDWMTKELCSRYARLEQKLGEVDRARGLYIHASQFANPQQDVGFWEEWNQFELRHGNEDTFREMLRIKRSVTASFSQMHFNTTTVEIPSEAGILEAGGLEAIKAQETGGRAALEDSMAALEGIADKTVGLPGFIKSHAEGGTVGVVSNPDEIDIGEDEDDDEFEQRDRDVDVEQASVPASVFTGEGVS